MHLFCCYLTHSPTAQQVHHRHCPSVGLQISGQTVALLLLDLLSVAQCPDHLRPPCSPCTGLWLLLLRTADCVCRSLHILYIHPLNLSRWLCIQQHTSRQPAEVSFGTKEMK